MTVARSFFLILCLVFFCASVAVFSPLVLTGILFTLFCFGCAGWLAFSQQRRHMFSPPVLVLLYMGVGIGIKGLMGIASHESKIAGVLDPTSGEYRDVMLRVFLYGLLGAVMFVVGDRLAGIGRDAVTGFFCPTQGVSKRRVRLVLVVGSVMSLAAGAILVRQLGLAVILRPAFVSVKGTFGLFWLYPLLFAGIYAWTFAVVNDWVNGGRVGLGHVAGLVLAALFVYFLTSSKASLLTTVTIVLVARHYCVRPVSMAKLITVFLVFLVMLPVLYLHRAYGFNVEMIEHLKPEVLMTGLSVFLGRSYLADSFSAILIYTPNIYPYLLGKPWLEIFYFWVPRALWHDKPISPGLRFGETYLSSYPEAGKSFFTITMVGDGYMNFGPFGVALLLLILGLGLGYFYRKLISRQPHPGGILIYAAAVYPIAISAEQSLAVFWGLAFSYLAIAGFLVFLATFKFAAFMRLVVSKGRN